MVELTTVTSVAEVPPKVTVGFATGVKYLTITIPEPPAPPVVEHLSPPPPPPPVLADPAVGAVPPLPHESPPLLPLPPPPKPPAPTVAADGGLE
ncbi:MAG: hypothetical protein US09_C0028G0002 [Candidatus Moranbacteria bacterium GW2011_GWD1_36_198]|nr:MAG: hypothetical protein US09_C0028G0002 [Candidatus Moranbacteria bacterium GW2011_GWD1_36_198]